MIDELRERVARAIYAAEQSWDKEKSMSGQRFFGYLADAAIAVIVEECAKCAYDWGGYECDKLANEIRKLAKKGAT